MSQAEVHMQRLVGKALEGVCGAGAQGVRGMAGLLGGFLKICLAFILSAGWTHLGI